jgi:hypothetical protein
MNNNLKKLLIAAIITLILWYLISQPTDAAGAVHNALAMLKEAATRIVLFIRSLFA